MKTALSVKLKEEIEAMIPPAIFFFVALHVVALVRVLLLEGTGIEAGTSLSVTIAALIIAKAVLIADLMPFINRYPHKPLTYNIAWKSTIYFFVALLLHYLERLVDHWREAGGFIAGNEKLLAEIVWPHFWGIQILLVVLILVYGTACELARALGKDRLRQIFFGPHAGTAG